MTFGSCPARRAGRQRLCPRHRVRHRRAGLQGACRCSPSLAATAHCAHQRRGARPTRPTPSRRRLPWPIGCPQFVPHLDDVDAGVRVHELAGRVRGVQVGRTHRPPSRCTSATCGGWHRPGHRPPVDYVSGWDAEGEPVPGIGGGLPTRDHQQVPPPPVLMPARIPMFGRGQKVQPYRPRLRHDLRRGEHPTGMNGVHMTVPAVPALAAPRSRQPP